jgi:two-component system nitrate/nitrite response regulator NarP
MKKVLLADDHPFILSGIKAILRETEYEVVGALSCGDAVVEALPTLQPEILILDVNMPGRSGVEILRMLRSRGDTRPVILLTASLEDSLIIEALSLKVQGIVLKEGAQSQLLECLAAIQSGRRWIEQSLLQRALDISMNGSGSTPFDALTERERAIAALVAQGLRNKEVAAKIKMTEGTVKVYLHRIYEKLGVGSRTELALLARDVGGTDHPQFLRRRLDL